MTTPTPNTPLTADDVKLLRKGDWLLLGDRPLRVARMGATGWVHVQLKESETALLNALAFSFLGRPDQSGWIPTDGSGKNPAPGLRVDVRAKHCRWDRVSLSDDLEWSHGMLHGTAESESAITHWRPHAPAPAGEDHGIKGILGLPVRESDDTPIDWEAPPQPKGEVAAHLRGMVPLDRARHKLTYNTTPPIRSTRLDYDEATALLSTLTASQAREARAVEAITEAEKTFRWYGDLHAAKPDEAKAARNYELADRMKAALSEFIDNGEDGG